MSKARGGVVDQAAAERLLRRYLDERGWRYEWEQREFGGKRPDAVILSESGEPIAVIDATIVIEQADIKAAIIAEREGIMAVSTELTPSELPEVLLRTISRKAQQASPVAEAGLPYLLAAHVPRMPPAGACCPLDYREFEAIPSNQRVRYLAGTRCGCGEKIHRVCETTPSQSPSADANAYCDGDAAEPLHTSSLARGTVGRY